MRKLREISRKWFIFLREKGSGNEGIREHIEAALAGISQF